MMPKKADSDIEGDATTETPGEATTDQSFDLEDESRLPWLEPADDFDDEGAVSPTRLLAMVVGGLILIAVVLGGLWWVQNGGRRGDGELIAAQSGDYKTAPTSDHAKNFEGEGDARFAASEGEVPTGKVDATRMPEEPAVISPAKPAAKAAPVKAAATKPGSSAAASGGAATVQLGAYSSHSSAAKAWAGLTKRFAYLENSNQSITPVTVGGKTYYRLRIGAGSAAQAKEICGKLEVAGESCAIIS